MKSRNRFGSGWRSLRSRRSKLAAAAIALFFLLLCLQRPDEASSEADDADVASMLAAAANEEVSGVPAAPRDSKAALAEPLFGFTAFPYDDTLEALRRTQSLVLANSTIYAVHLDDGIPWREALADEPWPAKIEQEWRDIRGRIPKDRPLYLALAPLNKDRKALAPASQSSSLPWGLGSAKLDAPKVRTAYLNYVRRAISTFQPKFLNLGIEAGELAHRDPHRWPQYEKLYAHTFAKIKAENPEILIGMSFGLQSLMEPKVAQMVKPVVNLSDYIGISFYPHLSPFGEKFGSPPLPPKDDSWKVPLDWLRTYTHKPIAICETGFSSIPVEISRYGLSLKGSPDAQAAYVRDLFRIARRDHYLFAVWFCSVDYDRLYAKLPKGSEAVLMWRNTGLLDGEVRSKPAFEAWRTSLMADGKTLPIAPATNVNAAVNTPSGPLPAGHLGFNTESELFLSPLSDQITLEPDDSTQGISAMRWKYAYAAREWKWCAREIKKGTLSDAKELSFWLKSDRTEPLILTLEEADGESFYTVLKPELSWKKSTVTLDRMTVDPSKKRDGVLSPIFVTKIILADSGGTDGLKGARVVWISRLVAKPSGK